MSRWDDEEMDYDERNMNGQVKGGKRVNEGQNEVGREEKAVKLPMINVKGNVREGNMKEEKRERGKRGIELEEIVTKVVKEEKKEETRKLETASSQRKLSTVDDKKQGQIKDNISYIEQPDKRQQSTQDNLKQNYQDNEQIQRGDQIGSEQIGSEQIGSEQIGKEKEKESEGQEKQRTVMDDEGVEEYEEEFEEEEEEEQNNHKIIKSIETRQRQTRPIINNLLGQPQPKKNHLKPIKEESQQEEHKRFPTNPSTNSRDKTPPPTKSLNISIDDKYLSKVYKLFPNIDNKVPEEEEFDKLTREGEKIRTLIKTFNEELNELIKRSVLEGKIKKEEDKVEDILKMLEETRRGNYVLLEIEQKELQKLKNREEELNSGEIEHILDKRMIEMKNGIVEIGRIIVKLQLEIANEGNRLSKKEDDDGGQMEMAKIKVAQIKVKKEYDGNKEQLGRLEVKMEELNEKVEEVEKRLLMRMEEAKNKGINFVDIGSGRKEELMRELENAKNHLTKMVALIKTKFERVVHENEGIKSEINIVDNDVKNCLENCAITLEKSKIAINNAKLEQKISPSTLTIVESILEQTTSFTHHQPKEHREPSKEPKEPKEFPLPSTLKKPGKQYLPPKRVEQNTTGKMSQSVEDDLEVEEKNIHSSMLNKSKGKDRGMSRERRMSPSPSRAQYESLKIADGKVIEGAKMTLGNKNVEKEKLVLIGKKKMENNVNIVDKSHDEIIDHQEPKETEEINKQVDNEQQNNTGHKMMKFTRRKSLVNHHEPTEHNNVVVESKSHVSKALINQHQEIFIDNNIEEKIVQEGGQSESSNFNLGAISIEVKGMKHNGNGELSMNISTK